MASRKRKKSKKPKGRKLSTMVMHRIKDMMELTSSVKVYKQNLAAAVGKRYSPRLREGEALPDYVLVLDLAVRDAQAALDHLVKLDDDADDAEVDLIYLRADRDHLAKEELHPRAVVVRGAIDAAFGKQRGRSVHGMVGRTRRRPARLERQVRIAVNRLGNPKRELPPTKNPFSFVDRQGWHRQLKPLHRKLVTLEKKILQHAKELEGLIVFRKRAMSEFDATYGDALRLVVAAFGMARFDRRDIKNIKPYYQRRRLSAKARKRREARAERAAASAASAEAAEEAAPETFRPLAAETRAALSKTVSRWLEKRRMFAS